MKTRFTLTALASLLCFGFLGIACDQPDSRDHDSSDLDRDALFYIDDEPVYSVDQVPQESMPMAELIEDNYEDLTTAERDQDDQFRAFCVADCGTHMMSISGDACICRDHIGCTAADGGVLYAVTCAQM